MKISHQWLSDFLQTDLSVDKLSDILTDIGLEVEGTQKNGISKEDLEGFVVGRVLTCEKHPNADKLKVTTVDLGEGEPQQIVCGAPNVAAGQNVPVATIGTTLKDDKGNIFTIKKAKLRGEISNGMICSQKELRISDDNTGIWVMDDELKPGTPLSEVISPSIDYVYEIGLTPNRADAMSHYGVARDAYAALKSKKINASFTEIENHQKMDSFKESPIQVKIENSELCPRYSGIYLKNVSVKPSPQWLKNRLKSIGLSPKNNIVDITNYVLHGLGQPMHAFDADKIAGNTIIVKKSEKDTLFHTLDGIERKLCGEELMICDAEKPLGIAGVMGGLDSSVTNETKNIFIESAYFDPVSIRKTAKLHTINSDSSFRFERGIDPNFCTKALLYAIKLMQQYAGGEIKGSLIDLYPTPISPFSIILKYRNVDRILGERIHREKIKEILDLLDIEVVTENNDVLELRVPPYRVDVQREIDVIEEILRIYGYNSIQLNEKISTSIVEGEGFLSQRIQNAIADLLTAHGFNEAMNISMYKQEYNDWLTLEEHKNVVLINSLSKDLSTLRRSLLPSLLENIDYNLKRKTQNIRLFEFGKSYEKTNGNYTEKPTLNAIVTGNVNDENWNLPSQKVSFFYLKGIVEQVLKKCKIQDPEEEELNKPYYDFSLAYKIGADTIVHIAKIGKSLLEKFDIAQPVYYAEFNLPLLTALYEKNKGVRFEPLAKFPAVRRDLALLLDRETSYNQVKQTVIHCDQTHIRGVHLFDVYEGEKLPKDKKSYAIGVQLQDDTKTMTDSQIEAIMKKIIHALGKNLNAELRN